MTIKGLTNPIWQFIILFLIKTMETYELSDFKTGKKIKTEAKRSLFSLIANQVFGGIDCLEKKYKDKLRYGTQKDWMSTPITGMSKMLDDITGNQHGVHHQPLKTIAGTLSSQFKGRTPEVIKFLRSNTTNIEHIFKETKTIDPINKLNKTDFIQEIISSLKKFSSKEQKDIITALSSSF